MRAVPGLLGFLVLGVASLALPACIGQIPAVNGVPGGDDDGDPAGTCDYVRTAGLGNDVLNMRAEPELGGDILDGLIDGEVLERLADVEGDQVQVGDAVSDLWYYVSRDGQNGYISSLYATCTSAPQGGPDDGDDDGGGDGTGQATDFVSALTGTDDHGPWYVTLGLGQSWSFASGHMAEDWGMGNNTGKPIYSVASGEVVEVDRAIGNYVDIIVVRHELPFPTSMGDDVVYSRYGHINADVSVGQVVSAGEPIGTIADLSAFGFGSHLHLEIVNETAFSQGPYCQGCSGIGVRMSPGYTGYDFSDAGDWHDVSDGISSNRFYRPSSFIAADGAL